MVVGGDKGATVHRYPQPDLPSSYLIAKLTSVRDGSTYIAFLSPIQKFHRVSQLDDRKGLTLAREKSSPGERLEVMRRRRYLGIDSTLTIVPL